ncbi:MAG: hypothetical protein KIT22_05325 [Verrucomicrobiae bacterium]|nr:hypothetical protein [Verrucomicrobiae bacterium]
MNFDLKNRQQLLTILAFAVIGVWAADRLILTPLLDSWRARTVKTADLRKSVAQGTQLLARDRVIRERWDSMRTNTLPSAVSQAEGRVLGAFDRWSQDSRVSITSIKPQWKRDAEDYLLLECQVDASGSLSTISRFLYEIECDPLALKIDGLELTARDAAGSQLSLALQVSGLVLNLSEP